MKDYELIIIFIASDVGISHTIVFAILREDLAKRRLFVVCASKLRAVDQKGYPIQNVI